MFYALNPDFGPATQQQWYQRLQGRLWRCLQCEASIRTFYVQKDEIWVNQTDKWDRMLF